MRGLCSIIEQKSTVCVPLGNTELGELQIDYRARTREKYNNGYYIEDGFAKPLHLPLQSSNFPWSLQLLVFVVNCQCDVWCLDFSGDNFVPVLQAHSTETDIFFFFQNFGSWLLLQNLPVTTDGDTVSRVWLRGVATNLQFATCHLFPKKPPNLHHSLFTYWKRPPGIGAEAFNPLVQQGSFRR
jgi:hypothetical protein